MESWPWACHNAPKAEYDPLIEGTGTAVTMTPTQVSPACVLSLSRTATCTIHIDSKALTVYSPPPRPSLQWCVSDCSAYGTAGAGAHPNSRHPKTGSSLSWRPRWRLRWFPEEAQEGQRRALLLPLLPLPASAAAAGQARTPETLI